jgi:hypothetical protein
MFELKAEELRAVIGGATYYSAINKLPTSPIALALDLGGRPSQPTAVDRLTGR